MIFVLFSLFLMKGSRMDSGSLFSPAVIPYKWAFNRDISLLFVFSLFSNRLKSHQCFLVKTNASYDNQITYLKTKISFSIKRDSLADPNIL